LVTLKLQFLELRIPPPIAAVLFGIVMWRMSLVAPSLDVPPLVQFWLAPSFALVGVALAVSGAIAFRRAKTTINPTKPGAASSLVLSGVYGVTRNPMYVGLVLVLVAWAIFLSSWLTLAGPLLFAAYIQRFQIAPEERALAATFGADYSAYKARVRRWI
jgi:protein-S-isoprenylcysteine O-methyltransferase Ste14